MQVIVINVEIAGNEIYVSAFAILRKATISFVLSVCPSVCLTVCLSVHPSICPHAVTRLPLNGFSCNLMYEDFSKICREKSGFVKFD